MPWKESTRVTERMRFVCDHQSGLFSMTELCRRYGISRKTGYKWVHRFLKSGPKGLDDRSSVPESCPHRTPSDLADALCALREKHPTWGPLKLTKVLRTRQPEKAWPAPSTAGDILKRRGLVKPRRRRPRHPHPGRPTIRAESANALWTVDFKGDFLTRDGKRCYPLTLADRYSRSLLLVEGLASPAMQPVKARLERAFRDFGLPEAILSDNGTPFSSVAILGLSRLSVWWIKLGISPVLIEKGRPDQNGSHERMHRDLKAETARPPAENLGQQQRRFDRFRCIFNEERPHQALEMATPREHYVVSERSFPDHLGEVEYPGHFEVRRVRTHGEIKWQGSLHFLSECLAGEFVGLEETDDGVWSIYFCSTLLGRFDERSQKFSSGAPRRASEKIEP